MIRPPFFGFPYFNPRPQYKNTNYTNEYNFTSSKAKQKEDVTENINTSETPSNLSSPILNIFGKALYYDDILLICIIFFLYKEEVKDESLFVALILLLLN